MHKCIHPHACALCVIKLPDTITSHILCFIFEGFFLNNVNKKITMLLWRHWLTICNTRRKWLEFRWLNQLAKCSKTIFVTRSGPLRPKSIFFKIEILTESVNTHFKKYFGPNPSFIAHSWTKLWMFEVNMAQESEVK